jgi:tRNA threonylcarbamoyladenosine biosynthesis protein TsaE
MQKEYISKSLEETKIIAKTFLDFVLDNKAKDSATVVALYGNLGAGKTAFVKCIAELLGIKETVTSPTFVIMKKYTPPTNTPLPLRKADSPERGDVYKLVHIDAYRLEKAQELEALEFKKLLEDACNIIFIEWPEHVREILPKTAFSIQCKFTDESTRAYSFLIS